MNVLYCALDINEFDRISTGVSAKVIWDILEVTYEGTSQVKEPSSREEQQESTILCLTTHNNEENSEFSLDSSFEELLDAFHELMSEYKKLRKKTKKVKLLNKALTEQSKILDREKESIVNENQKLEFESLDLNILSKKSVEENESLKIENVKKLVMKMFT